MKEKFVKSRLMLELCQKLIDTGVSSYNQMQGCSSEEIEQLENYTKYPLPEMYKQFLINMGHSVGKFFDGTDIFYKAIFENRMAASELLEEDQSDFKLAETDFVFASHQGYEFMYFSLSENDDPSVYYYIEGAKLPHKKWERFSEFLIQSVDEYIHLLGNK